VRCARCGKVSADDALFCEQCGAKFNVACSSCGATLTVGAKFCKRCGAAALDHEVKSIRSDSSPAVTIHLDSDPGSAQSLDGERKTVTALFADIKGSTELEQNLDPEEARAIVDPVLHLMMEAVHRYGGYIAQAPVARKVCFSASIVYRVCPLGFRVSRSQPQNVPSGAAKRRTQASGLSPSDSEM
jgi:ribosomal protein L40E